MTRPSSGTSRSSKRHSPFLSADLDQSVETDSWEVGRGIDKEDNGLPDVQKPEVSFADVGGMEEIKEEIRMKIIYPIQNQALLKAYGKKIGWGECCSMGLLVVVKR